MARNQLNANHTFDELATHASFGGLAQHAERLGDNYWEPAIQPSLEGCEIALNVAHYCAIRPVETLVQMNEADSSPSILDLKKDYDSAWGFRAPRRRARALCRNFLGLTGSPIGLLLVNLVVKSDVLANRLFGGLRVRR